MSFNLLVPVIGAGVNALINHYLNQDSHNGTQSRFNAPVDTVNDLGWRKGYAYGSGQGIRFRATLSADTPVLDDPVAAIYLSQCDKPVRAGHKANADSDGDLIACGTPERQRRGYVVECVMHGDAYRRLRKHAPVQVLVSVVDQGVLKVQSRFQLKRGRELLEKVDSFALDSAAYLMTQLMKIGPGEFEGCYRGMIKTLRDQCSLTSGGLQELRKLMHDNQRFRASPDDTAQLLSDRFDAASPVDLAMHQALVFMIADEIAEHERYHLPHIASWLRSLASRLFDPKVFEGIHDLADAIEAEASRSHNSYQDEANDDDRARQDALATLQLDSSATAGDIKRAYRALMKELHPDRMATAPQAVRRVIEEEVKKLNSAYALLRDGQ